MVFLLAMRRSMRRSMRFFVPMGWSQEVRYHDCAGSGVVHLVGTTGGMDPMPWIPSQKQRKGTFKAISIYGTIF